MTKNESADGDERVTKSDLRSLRSEINDDDDDGPSVGAVTATDDSTTSESTGESADA